MADDEKTATAKVIPIVKPSRLDKFKSKRAASIGALDRQEGPLPHHSISQAKDFVRLHPDQAEFWSPELCFVSVPIQGVNKEQLHLIDEDVAAEADIPSGKLSWFRLALATKPFDVFFLCHVPTRNLEDNTWNITNARACEEARIKWVEASSRRAENKEGYATKTVRDVDAFPAPKWPTQTLDELIETTFEGRMIDDENHAGLKRLVGAKQSVK